MVRTECRQSGYRAAMTSVAAWILTVCGISLVRIGGFFVAARPKLLPEDARFMGSTTDEIQARPRPGLLAPSCVLGAGRVGRHDGVLVVYVAHIGLRAGSVGELAVLAISGVMSLGLMTAVNFVIRSDFRLALLCLDRV